MNNGRQTSHTGSGENALKKCAPYIIAALSLLASLFYNELNIQAIRSEAPERANLKYNSIKTADDASYMSPAENYFHKGIWRDNNPGKQSYFVREPGYGIFRYIQMKIFGIEKSFSSFKYIQLLLFGISVFFLFYISILSGLQLGYALVIEAVYGISPFASGFVYYSITEGITPALMILYVFFLLYGYKNSRPLYFLVASLILGYIGLTRPVLLLFGAGLPLAVWWSDWHLSSGRKATLAILTIIIALAPISIWAIRSAKIAGKYVGIYPIYYVTNNSQFRLTHKSIWEFEKSYGTGGLTFHQSMVPLWKATITGENSDIRIDSIMMQCPAFVKQTIGEERLRRSFKLYQQSIIYQRSHYPSDIAMPDTIPAIEQQVISDFNIYTLEINSKHWFWCHVVAPLKLFKALSFHSNLSLYMFQHTYRGRWWMESLRVIFLLLHFLCCLSFIGILLVRGDKLIKVLFGLVIGVYIFYLCYVFRALEERYTLPILPFMLLSLAYGISVLTKKNSSNQ